MWPRPLAIHDLPIFSPRSLFNLLGHVNICLSCIVSWFVFSWIFSPFRTKGNLSCMLAWAVFVIEFLSSNYADVRMSHIIIVILMAYANIDLTNIICLVLFQATCSKAQWSTCSDNFWNAGGHNWGRYSAVLTGCLPRPAWRERCEQGIRRIKCKAPGYRGGRWGSRRGAIALVRSCCRPAGEEPYEIQQIQQRHVQGRILISDLDQCWWKRQIREVKYSQIIQCTSVKWGGKGWTMDTCGSLWKYRTDQRHNWTVKRLCEIVKTPNCKIPVHYLTYLFHGAGRSCSSHQTCRPMCADTGEAS